MNSMKKKNTSKENKQNYQLAKQLTSNSIFPKNCRNLKSQTQKFGKAIRAKAAFQYECTPLKQLTTPTKNINRDQRRQSAFIQAEKPFLCDIKDLSISFLQNNQDEDQSQNQSMISNSRVSKMKSVRFSQHPQNIIQSPSKSRSLRKSSILKNSNISNRSNKSDILSVCSNTSHVGSIMGGISAKTSVKDGGVICENRKYETTLKSLIQKSKKYFDDLFPPGGASLYHTKSKSQKYQDIRWVRMDEVFLGKKCVLYSHTERNLVKTGDFQELNYMASAFNALGTSARCIQKIFQNQKYSRYGIYYLRLYHEGIWKYVVVDDYIPVKKIGHRGYSPVFMNVQQSKSQYFQLWPFLLQKALAKIYSTYQCLMGDTAQNCLQQLTAVIPVTYNLNPNQRDINLEYKIRNHLLNPDNIIIGCNPLEKQQNFIPLNQYTEYNTQGNAISHLQLLSSYSSFNRSVYLSQLYQNFKSIKTYTLQQTYYSIGCIIKQHKQNSISLRKFKSDGYGTCVISLTQKDKKYYRNNGYKYTWMRLMLAIKDVDGYRFVDGTYSNDKVINVTSHIQPGQYYMIIIGQWNKKVFDITLNYQGNIQISIERQQINKKNNIIAQTCRDIAQRFGTFKQINKNICSYQCIDYRNGLIIENLNNQIDDRGVYFHRKYQLPFSRYKTLGNIHFGQDNHNEIQGFIQGDSNVTLVLMPLKNCQQKNQKYQKCQQYGIQHFQF